MLVDFQIKIFAIYFYIRDAVKVTSYIFHVLMFLDSVFFSYFLTIGDICCLRCSRTSIS